MSDPSATALATASVSDLIRELRTATAEAYRLREVLARICRLSETEPGGDKRTGPGEANGPDLPERAVEAVSALRKAMDARRTGRAPIGTSELRLVGDALAELGTLDLLGARTQGPGRRAKDILLRLWNAAYEDGREAQLAADIRLCTEHGAFYWGEIRPCTCKPDCAQPARERIPAAKLLKEQAR